MTRRYSLVFWLVLAAPGGGCHTTPTFPTEVSRPDPLFTVVPSPIIGTFDLTLEVGASCAAVPPAERTRRYTATIASTGGRSVVTLSGATFLSGEVCTSWGVGLGCHQFRASEDLGWMGVELQPQDEARGGRIVERLASGGWLEITGTGGGAVQDWDDFVLTLDGDVWYCPSDVDFPFDVPCVGARGSGHAGTSRFCDATRSHLRFVRR